MTFVTAGFHSIADLIEVTNFIIYRKNDGK
nr:hypothetical protein [Sicyoidochytrium minutum DNA virus]